MPRAPRAVAQMGLGLLALAVLLGLAGPAWGQAALIGRRSKPFLGRTREEGYLNYARDPTRSYGAMSAIFKVYDDFGNYLTEGYPVWFWEERRPGIGRGLIGAEDGSFRSIQFRYESIYDLLMEAGDKTRGWHYRLNVSDRMRTHFTSLTLSLPRFAGVRFDVASEKNRGTFLATKGWTQQRSDIVQKPGGGPFALFGAGDGYKSQINVTPVPLFALRWETDIGDAVTLGSTFVNQHQQDVTRKDRLFSARGSLPYPMLPPGRIIIHFTDDTPEDGGGAAVFDVRVRVIAEGDSVLTRFIPSILGGQVVGDHREANGNDELSFAYDMPISPLPVAMEVEAVVANDYRIAVSQSHKFYEGRSSKQIDAEGNRVEFVDRASTPVVITRSEGNVQDFSNKALVKFRYGFNTGQSVYGADLRANVAGAHIQGEFALSSVYQQFSTRPGQKLSPLRDSAWFLTAERPFVGGFMDVGAELFRIGPKYAGYQTTRSGPLLYTDNGGGNRTAQVTTEFPWVEDNDDGDQYPDDDPSFDSFGALYGRAEPIQDAGVFPGRDEDLDGNFDEDRNENGRPDWKDPFILYYSDPIEFVFGWDNNNNGFVDQREDDEWADYRYSNLGRRGKDVEGQHAFVRFNPLRNRFGWGEGNVGLGWFDQDEPASGGINRGRYVRTQYRYEARRWGAVELDHESKRVRDTVPNSVYTFGLTAFERETTKPSGPIPGDRGFDNLLYRNSMAHQAWLGTTFTGVLNLTVDNSFKVLQNHQLPLEGQVEARRTMYTMVNRADYRLRFGHWTIWPQFKRLTLIERERVEERSGVTLRSQSWTAPIFKVEYQLTRRTKLLFGQQGVRVGWADKGSPIRNFFAFRFRDKADPEVGFSATDQIIAFQNWTNYWGRKLHTSVGFHRSSKEFIESANRFLDERSSRLFVEVITGY